MMRQAPAEPYDTLVNTSSCLTLYFFDTGRLVFTLYCYTVISRKEILNIVTGSCQTLYSAVFLT